MLKLYLDPSSSLKEKNEKKKRWGCNFIKNIFISHNYRDL